MSGFHTLFEDLVRKWRENVEKGLEQALINHLGRMPDLEEIKEKSACSEWELGVMDYLWEGKLICRVDNNRFEIKIHV